jgi:uncharacterized cupredoxin-like copper-binding protein
MYRFHVTGGLIAATALISCQSERPPESSRGPVQVTARDFAFDSPKTVPAGATTMRLRNQGTELHHAQVVRLEQGKTANDLAEALKRPGLIPEWVKLVGGPNAVVPGKETDATALLEPGRHALICFIFGPDKIIHANKGMIQEFEVTETSDTAQAKLPPADLTIKLVDYDFQASAQLRPGRQTILVENAGPQPHELALLKLAPGKTVEDFAHWAENGLKGPPPAEPIGGVVFLDKNESGTFTAELTPGDYGLICFVPDAKDGKPHLAHGMMKNIKVS